MEMKQENGQSPRQLIGKRRQRRRFNDQQKRQIIEGYHKSDQTQRTFCLQRDLNPSTLRRWLAADKDIDRARESAGGFVAVSLNGPTGSDQLDGSSREVIVVELAKGHRLSLPAALSVDSIKHILHCVLRT